MPKQNTEPSPTFALGVTRRTKLTQRFEQSGMRGLLRWTGQWLYWNGQLYHIAIARAKLSRAVKTNELRLRWKMRRRHKKFNIQDPIIVYQMGKVGSTTIYRSLQELDLDVPIYQLHFLTELDDVAAWAQEHLNQPATALRAVERARRVRQEIQANPEQSWNLVSMVRLPIPRLISSFWENIESNVPEFQRRHAAGKLSAQEIIDIFLHNLPHDWAEYWYDRQLKSIFEIDVFAEPFERDAGYRIYRGQRARLLLLRLEDLDRVAAPALYEFLAIPHLALRDRNVGRQKNHGALYREFLERLRLPDEFIARTHNTRYALHFYTYSELEASVRRWRA
ncbi:MAG: hypothetical protein DCC52_15825 [Chloroflexi bacterium]|nr:MAG: hypothetical protein DCC52_15825 [Chloroflexota bacterium]